MQTLEFQNVSMFRSGEFMGNISRMDCKTVKIETGLNYAQYQGTAMRVTFLEKGKRKARCFMLTYDPFLVVMPISDAVIPESMLGEPTASASGLCETRQSRYSGHDPRWRSDFSALLEGKPILWQVGVQPKTTEQIQDELDVRRTVGIQHFSGATPVMPIRGTLSQYGRVV